MKLLIDQNISHRIVALIQPNFNEVVHVKTLGLIDATDVAIFFYARQNLFDAVVTLDEDFHNIQAIHGTPPKIIWLRNGNCTTASLAEIILSHEKTIHEFMTDAAFDCLEIY